MSIPASVLDATDKSIKDKLDEHDRVWNAAIEAAAKEASEYDSRFTSDSLSNEIRKLKK